MERIIRTIIILSILLFPFNLKSIAEQMSLSTLITAQNVQYENCANPMENTFHLKAMKAKMPSWETILKWLGYIADVLPTILDIISKLPTTNAEPNTQQNNHSVAYSTTA